MSFEGLIEIIYLKYLIVGTQKNVNSATGFVGCQGQSYGQSRVMLWQPLSLPFRYTMLTPKVIMPRSCQ